MSSNVQIAQLFSRIADLLELKEANPFRIRAYRRAAQVVEVLSEDLSALAAEDRLEEIQGIGKDLAEKIRDFLASGTISEYEKLRAEVPAVLVQMTRIPGLGPRNALKIHRELGLQSLEALEEAGRSGVIAQLDGFGPKSEQNILEGIEFVRRALERRPLGMVLPIAEALARALADLESVEAASIAGSLRRMKETVGDADLVAASRSPEDVMAAFVENPGVEKVLAHGDTKASIRVAGDIQIDLRVVEPEVFGAALLHFTGSKEHNVRLREMALKKGLKVNEYGIFDVSGKERADSDSGDSREGKRADSDSGDPREGKRAGSATEEACYGALGLPWIPPELREDTGEIQAALAGNLPDLIDLDDIRGDLHAHTDASDAKQTLEELIAAARKLGYRYVGVTDHSQSLKIAGGLDLDRMKWQIDRVREADERFRDFTLLVGTEVDILRDGRLDYPDDLLEQLDVVIASVHTNFKLSREDQTRRVCAAMENPLVFGIGHPTGRLLGVRDAYEIDMDAVIEVAARTGTALEISANPHRLDLNDRHARQAHDAGVPLFISTDAHRPGHFDFMRFGVKVARRAWLEPGAVVNTFPLRSLRKALGAKRT
jgi:DNA polymerase (family 10)